MIRRSCITVIVASFTLLLAGCAAALESGRPSLGSLQHRGKNYAVRDLVDPAYRDASSDQFVRQFNPDTVLAREDASIGRR